MEVHRIQMLVNKKYLSLVCRLLIALIILLGLFFGPFILVQLQYRFGHLRELEQGSVEKTSSSEEVKLAPNTIYIPSINLTAPLVYPSLNPNGDYQEFLEKGVVHFPGTAEVGEIGNSYFFGHSSDLLWRNNSYAHVFALLPKVEVGDSVFVTDKTGNTFKYQVFERFVTDPKNVSLLRQDFVQSKTMTLQTSYPFGTALKRFIIKANSP